jgi:hypothetical protein
MAVYPASNYSSENVLRDVHDQSTQSLRTTALAVVPPGQFEVVLNHTEDSVRLGDGTSFFTATNILGKNGLDVNIINNVNTIITDGTDALAINSDGSINVNVISSGSNYLNKYNEVTGVATGITTVVVTHTSTINTFLQQVMMAGNTPAVYELLVNSVVFAKQYTYYTNLNGSFDFSRGLQINIGDIVQLKVTHDRTNLGSFNGNIIFVG